jgi:hypothetical protein
VLDSDRAQYRQVLPRSQGVPAVSRGTRSLKGYPQSQGVPAVSSASTVSRGTRNTRGKGYRTRRNPAVVERSATGFRGTRMPMRAYGCYPLKSATKPRRRAQRGFRSRSPHEPRCRRPTRGRQPRNHSRPGAERRPLGAPSHPSRAQERIGTMTPPIERQFQDHFYGAIWLSVEDEREQSPTEPLAPRALAPTDDQPDQANSPPN